MLASFLAAPRAGHLDAVFHIFAYLKKHSKSTLVFDDTYRNIDFGVSFSEIGNFFILKSRKEFL